MKQYPSIPATVSRSGQWYVFDKLDGSNIRAEWSKKKGFYKFGSRKQLIGGNAESDQQNLLTEAIDLIKAHESSVASVFKKMREDRGVFFFEFFGPSSFAGLHHEDEEHEVVLFDVHVHKRGMMDPRDLLEHFGGLPLPELLHRGPFGLELEERVRAGELEGMTFEGVVAKAPRAKRWSKIDMFKVKNREWVDRVKERYGEKAEAL